MDLSRGQAYVHLSTKTPARRGDQPRIHRSPAPQWHRAGASECGHEGRRSILQEQGPETTEPGPAINRPPAPGRDATAAHGAGMNHQTGHEKR